MSPPVPIHDRGEPADAIVAFTDGSAIGNGKKNARAGFACVFPYHPEMSMHGPLGPTEKHTNNRAEYSGVLAAFRLADQIERAQGHQGPPRRLIVYTDSQLLVNSLTRWLPGWKRRGWTKANGEAVLNQDLLLELDACMRSRRLELHHIRAAHGRPGAPQTGMHPWLAANNTEADRRARLGSRAA